MPTTATDTATATEDPSQSAGPGASPSTASAAQREPGGDTSDGSDTATITVDATAPAMPVVTTPTPDSTLEVRPSITGTGEPDATVTVRIDDTPVGTAAVRPGGGWTLTPAEDLDAGSHTVTAIQRDPAGNDSPESDPVPITVEQSADVTPPDSPRITSPADGDLVGPLPTVTGTAEPGSVVTVIVDDVDEEYAAGSTPVDADGSWSLTLTEALSPGFYLIFATATDADGNESEESEPVFVQVPGNAAPVRITSPTDGSTVPRGTRVAGTGEPGSEVVIEVFPGDVVDELSAELGNQGVPEAGVRTTVTRAGAAATGLTGRALVDRLRAARTGTTRYDDLTDPDEAEELGDTTVAADGRWSVAESLSPATYTVIAGQFSPDGDAKVSDPVAFTVVEASTGAGSNSGGSNSGGSNSGGSNSGGSNSGGSNSAGSSGSAGISSGSTAGSLAETGGPSALAPLVGGLLVLGGVLLLAIRRRRAQPDSRTSRR